MHGLVPDEERGRLLQADDVPPEIEAEARRAVVCKMAWDKTGDDFEAARGAVAGTEIEVPIRGRVQPLRVRMITPVSRA